MTVWIAVAAFGLAACGGGQAVDELSPQQEQYLESIAEIQGRVDSAFESVEETMARTYNTREVLFAAIRDVGYEGVGVSVLVLAETLEPPPEYEDDHERWLAHRKLAVDLGPELTAAIGNQDIREMLEVFTALFEDWSDLVLSVEPEVCRALNQIDLLCPPQDDLPGGDYGVEVYEVLRREYLRTAELFNFFGDMSPSERALRLADVQPKIEASLKTGGDEMKAIDPPAEYEDDHRAIVDFFEQQLANAVAITEANAAGDDARVRQLFDASVVTFETAVAKLSPEYREIAAPFVGPDDE